MRKPIPDDRRCEFVKKDGRRCGAPKISEHYCFMHEPKFEGLRRQGREKAWKVRTSRVARLSFECDTCQIENCKKRQPGAKCFYVTPFRSIDIDDADDLKRIFTDLVALELGSIHFYKLQEKLGRKAFQREVSRAIHRLSDILENYYNITKGKKITVNVKREQEIETIKTLANLYLEEQRETDWKRKMELQRKIKELTQP